MALVLHASITNKNAIKCLVTAEYVGVKVEATPDFEIGVSNKTPEFLKLNPFGKIPVLETPDGPLFESNAIARYVAKHDKDGILLGSSLYDSALIEQWIDVATTEVDANLSRWIYPLLGYYPYVAEASEAALGALKTALCVLNEHLAANTYLVGHSVTLADIILASNLLPGFRAVFTKEFLAEFPHLERYFWTIAKQPTMKKYFGDLPPVEKIPTPPKKQGNTEKKEEKKAKGEKPKDVHKPKAQKSKEAEKPKEGEPKPNKESLGDEEEEEEKPKQKAKNPLDLLPPSSMVLDEWKRLYSNTKAKDFREVAIAGFWKMYDPEGYSMWFCDYKYNDENMVTFVTMNKVSGFLQRMDLIRKYGFAKMCIFGETDPFKIKGVWLFRGQEIPQIVLDECYDMELYDWTKVDITDEAQKERVNAYFEEPDEFDNEKLLEAKCFK